RRGGEALSIPVIAAGDIFPDTTRIDRGHLVVGGCDMADLAARYGTPLYVFDEASILARARGYRDALARSYPGASIVCYASKAYSAPWILSLLADEGVGLDVVSAGELFVGAKVDFPRERIYFHGNNKGEDERLVAFAKEMREERGVALREISPGGGFGVRYTTEDPAVKAADMIGRVGAVVAAAAKKFGFDPLPEVSIEPGRSMVANTA